jgi:hypothetical protein
VGSENKIETNLRYASVKFAVYCAMQIKNLRPPLSALSVAELRIRACDYRKMAATARPAVAHTGLLKLALRLDALADARENKPIRR